MAKRWVIVAVVCASLVAAMFWWRRDRSAEPTVDAVGSSPPPSASAAAPRWFGRHNVAGRMIAGTVVDGTGAPIAGASVRAASTLTMSRLRPEPSATTDAAGRFDLGPQPASAYIVVAESSKLTAAITHVDLRDAVSNPDRLRLVLHPCDAAIHGTIRDAAGGTIAGAIVARAEQGLSASTGAVTDDAGRYELCVPPANAFVRVRADGYATLQDLVNVYGRTRRDFTLSPGATIAGRAVNAIDKSPIAGAIIEIRDPRLPLVAHSASTDSDGKFQLDGVTPGRHPLLAYAERLTLVEPVHAVAEIGKPPEEVICELVPTLAISGKVVERGTGAPQSGLSVIAWSTARSATTRVPQAISQPDGTFTIDHIVPGEYRMDVAELPTPNATKVTADKADAIGVVLEIEPTATISGRVLHAGKPIEGAHLQTMGSERSRTARSDADGRYTLRHVRVGAHELYAESQRMGAFTRGNKVTLAAGEHRTFDLELDLTGSISGIVVDQHGAPVPGVFLSFSLVQGSDFGLATTADDGTFSARAMAGGGDYMFEVRQSASSPLVFPPLVGKHHIPVGMPDGRTRITGLRIQVRVERLAISGRLVDADGKPQADVAIQAFSLGDSSRIPPTSSDASGAFTVGDLSPGKYMLRARSAHGEVTENAVVAGRSDLVLRLQPFGAIEGTIEGTIAADDASVVPVGDYSRIERVRIRDNAFRISNLPPGKYKVSVERMHALVEVAPGGTAKVTLKKREAGAIAGTVVDDKGTPLAKIECDTVVVEHAKLRDGSELNTTVSDERGVFHFNDAEVGPNVVLCENAKRTGTAKVDVVAGGTARVHVVISSQPKRQSHAGFTLARPLKRIVVTKVEAGGAAARAGIVAGDILTKIETVAVDDPDIVEAVIRESDPGTVVRLTLERFDKELVVSVRVVEAP